MRGIFRRRKYSDEMQTAITASRTIGQVMAEWRLTAPDYITGYDISYFEDYMYIKIYYTTMTIPQKNDLFLKTDFLRKSSLLSPVPSFYAPFSFALYALHFLRCFAA